MSVCKNIKGYTRKHERLADFFSLLAVAQFLGTLFFITYFYSHIASWVSQDVIIHVPLSVAAVVLDVVLIIMFLNFGATRFSDEDEELEGCFHTFKGRRSGAGSIGMAFSSWLHHMEQVGRKHR